MFRRKGGDDKQVVNAIDQRQQSYSTPTRRTNAIGTSCIPSTGSPQKQRDEVEPQKQAGKPVIDDLASRTANGTIIAGRWRLVRTIGKGSYGKVKLGTDLQASVSGDQISEDVAIKFIAKSSIKKPAHSARIHREINLMRALHHPGVVQLYETIETAFDIILIMEYIKGADLYERIVAHPQQYYLEVEARPIVEQLVSAVAYCHRHRVVHRDLKPENVMLDEQGGVKLIDFGFANMYHPRGRLETNCGSPLYAAPEIVQGVKYTGPEVDIWSLGVVFYAMLTGMLPFEDDQLKGLYAKICAGVYSTPSHLSAGARDLLRAMLTTDPRARLTIDQVMRHPWIHGFSHSLSGNCGLGIMQSIRMQHAICNNPREHILRSMAPLGFPDLALLRLTIRTDPDDPATAIYNLLVAREERKNIRLAPCQIPNSESLQISNRTGLANVVNGKVVEDSSNSIATHIEPDFTSKCSYPNDFVTTSRFGPSAEADWIGFEPATPPSFVSSGRSMMSGEYTASTKSSNARRGKISSKNPGQIGEVKAGGGGIFGSPGSIVSQAAASVASQFRRLRGLSVSSTPRSVAGINSVRPRENTPLSGGYITMEEDATSEAGAGELICSMNLRDLLLDELHPFSDATSIQPHPY